MSEINDGGFAFPTTEGMGGIARKHNGLTMRDYFAAKAMQGMFAADTSESVIAVEVKASLAYAMADAMLKARGES